MPYPMKNLLPPIRSEQDYRRVYADESIWLPAMRALCQRHGLDPDRLQRMGLGTHVAFRSGDRIIKLFAGPWAEDYTSESACLKHITGLPVPELMAEGELEDWPYIVMGAVPGTPAVEVWEELALEDKRGVVAELGRIMATLHALPPLPGLGGDWNVFLQERLQNAEEHHDAPPPWRAWINRRLDGFAPTPRAHVLLSADITEDHLLLSEENGRWRVSGFIDFGDARMGHPFYEFIAPLAFYTVGTPELSRLLVESYGLDFSADLAEELTTWCLLHEFGRLRDFTDKAGIESPEELCRALWGDTALGGT